MSKVSIVIPHYNQGKYLEQALTSAVNQTYKNIEIVCIDDSSIDNTSEVIEQLSKKYKNVVFYVNPENKGVCFSRNYAIEHCTGEYILPLDADDTIEPTYVEKAVKILDENKNIGIVYCRARMFGKRNEERFLPEFNKSNILYENCIFNSALFRKQDFLKVGGYNENMRYGCEDYNLWLSILELGVDVYRINEVLFNYRCYDEQSRSDVCVENISVVLKQLVKNHLNMYLNDAQFLDRVFFTDLPKLKKQHKKYKKLFNRLLPICITELVILIILVFRLLY